MQGNKCSFEQVGYADMLSIMRHRLVTVDEVQQMGATQNQDVARVCPPETPYPAKHV